MRNITRPKEFASRLVGRKHGEKKKELKSMAQLAKGTDWTEEEDVSRDREFNRRIQFGV